MNVEVTPAGTSDASILTNLMQLYLYDFAELGGPPLMENGLFDYPWLDDYWHEDGRYPFLVRVDGALAGFVLAAARRLFEDGGEGLELTELFVMRPYRRRGVGRHAAVQVLRRFPGPWSVGVLATNEAALGFWSKVIGELTNDDYRVEEREGEGRRAVELRFRIGSVAD